MLPTRWNLVLNNLKAWRNCVSKFFLFAFSI